MKRSIAALLLLSFIFCLTACGGSSPDAIVEKAITALEKSWSSNYYASGWEDRHIQIKNTRIITIKETDIEEFKDIDYIVEFVLFTNYYDSSPYYSSAGVYDSVIIYSNGETEVPQTNALKKYSFHHYSFDYSEIIESVEDCGDKYNLSKKLK